MDSTTEILITYINRKNTRFKIFDKKIHYKDTNKTNLYKSHSYFIKDLLSIIEYIGNDKGRNELKEQVKNILV